MYSVDIETACNVAACKGTACDHALSPWHGRITKIGVVSATERLVFNNADEFNSWSSPGTWLGHNFKFDLLWLQVHGVDISKVYWHCTQLMAYVLTEKIPDRWLADYEAQRVALSHNGQSHHRKAGKHNLKTLAPYLLKVEPFWETKDKEDDEYVLKDASYTLDLYYVLEKKLKERGEWDFYLRLLNWTKMLLAAEVRGIRIDLAALDKKEIEVTKEISEIRDRLNEIWTDANQTYVKNLQINCASKYSKMAQARGKFLEAGTYHWKLYEAALSKLPRSLNYESDDQMLWLLQDYLGYDCRLLAPKKNKKTGKIQVVGTGIEVLERLAAEGKKDIEVFIQYREKQKLLEYIESYREWKSNETMHPTFNPDSTKTGRTSSQRVNMQQVTDELKPLFKARPGYKFIGYDAAAIEAKLIALYSGDRQLYNVVASGQSLHDVNTRVFFGLPDDSDIKRDYPVHRSATKNVGFALFYGAGANRLRITFAQKGFHFSQSQCEEILRRFKNKYSTAIQYHKDITRFFESGEKMTNLLGRPVMIEDASEAYMKGFNSIIQGSASDLNLEGAERAWNECKQKGIDATPLLFVHDFTLFEVREDQVPEANEIIVLNLINFPLNNEHGPIALTVEGGVSDHWSK